MRKLLSVTMIFAAICAWAQERDYALKIGDFSEFTVADGVPVIYKASTDSAGYACFRCGEKATSALTFSCNKNKLKIQLSADVPLSKVPVVTIYSTALVKVSNWGDSTVVIARSNPAVEFKAKVVGNGEVIAKDLHTTKVSAAVEMGSGHIYLTGKSQSASYTIMSAGSIEAGSLEAARVKAKMVGTGNIDCWATESLTVVGAGSGHVYYKGNPPTVKNRGLGVKIDPITEN